MDDLIGRQAEIDIVEFECGEWRGLAKTITEEIEQLPSAQRKTGKWLRTDAYPHRIYCSACYATYVPNDEWGPWENCILPRNFCPNCGADMRGEYEDH